MKMTAAEKKERRKELFLAGPVGVWIRIGQEVGYVKAFILLSGVAALFAALGLFIN